MEPWVLKVMDKQAKELHMNRSGYLEHLVREKAEVENEFQSAVNREIKKQIKSGRLKMIEDKQ